MQIVFKDFTGDIDSLVRNDSVESRTYTFPDKNGIIAMLDDIQNIVNDPALLEALAFVLAPYLDPLLGPPAITTPPEIIGTPQAGQTLGVTSGTVTGLGFTTVYDWYRDAVFILRGNLYLLNTIDEGTTITVNQISTNARGTDEQISAGLLIQVSPDTTPPIITDLSVGGIGAIGFTIHTETDESSIHYYLVVPAGSTGPTTTQVVLGANYEAVTISASGSSGMGFVSDQLVDTLTASTSYDVYIVAVDAFNNQSLLSTNAGVSTTSASGFTYVPITARPPLDLFATLTFVDPGNVLNSSGGTTRDKVLSGHWSKLRLFSFAGVSGTTVRISNENGATTFGGSSAAEQGIANVGTGTNFYEINGKSPSEPMYFAQVGGISNVSMIQANATSFGLTATYTNMVANNSGFGIFMNTPATLSGGSASVPCTSSIYYQNITVSFIRGFSCATEFCYAGNTTTNGYAIHRNFTMTHCLSNLAGWDGIQFNNHLNCNVSNVTAVDSGQDTIISVAQRQNFQLQNFKGQVINSILMRGHKGGMFCGYDILFKNNYVSWNDGLPMQVLSYNSNYGATNRLFVSPVGLQILIEDCDLVNINGTTGALLVVSDANVNITVRNCRINGCASLFQDNRGGSPTGTLTDGGGNTFVSDGVIEEPTFVNLTPTDFQNHGCLNNAYHYNLGRGFRTPPPSGIIIAPTVQALNLNTSVVTATSMTVNWTRGNGQGVIVLVKAASAVNSLPVNDTNYTANAEFGDGSQLGTGNFVVYKGTGTSVTLTGLSASTTYHIRAFEFNGAGVTSKFFTNTATNNPISDTTEAALTPPSTQASSIIASAVTHNSFDLDWTDGNGDGVLVLIKAGGAVDANPSDGVDYTANAAFGSGTQIGTGNYVVFKGAGTSVSVTGLAASTTYHVRAYAFNGILDEVDFNVTTASGNPISQATSAAPPAVTRTVLISFGSATNPTVTGDARTWNYANTNNPDASYGLPDLVDEDNVAITGLDIDVTAAFSDQAALGSTLVGTGDASDFPAQSARDYWYAAGAPIRTFRILIPASIRGRDFTSYVMCNKLTGTNEATITIGGVTQGPTSCTSSAPTLVFEQITTVGPSDTFIAYGSTDGVGISPINALKLTWEE